MHSKERYHFVCYEWFGDKKGQQMERILSLSDGCQLAGFRHLFSNNVRLNDDYLWGSLFSRPLPSNFTRVQRLSCCTAALCLSMITNAMFFNTADRVDATKVVTLGPLRFSLGTLYIAFISSLITMPATMLMPILFLKSRRYNTVTPIQEHSTDETTNEDSPKPPLSPAWAGVSFFRRHFCPASLSSRTV
ncbi:polycystin-1-like protein 3 [Glandiceps talaboti]